MPKTKHPLFDVVRAQDHAIVRADLDETDARRERALLNDQARANGYRHLGAQVVYELKTKEGLIVA
jgi:hypothetical protein